MSTTVQPPVCVFCQEPFHVAPSCGAPPRPRGGRAQSLVLAVLAACALGTVAGVAMASATPYP